MDDQNRVDRLREALQNRPMRADLDPVKSIASEIFDPSVVNTVIQVVGSNGKGSFIHYFSNMLATTDTQVVSYTSPHIQWIGDRIQIDADPLSNEELDRVLGEFDYLIDETFTPFEILLLATLQVAQNKKPDCLILEAGMGGRWDATSAIPADWTVLTGVDLEHTEYLGETYEEILTEKLIQMPDSSHLLKPGLEPPRCESVVKRILTQKQANSITVDASDTADQTLREMALTLGKIRNPKLSIESVYSAVFDIAPPSGRREMFEFRDIEWILDVAHTPRASKELLGWVEDLDPDPHFLLFGSLHGKSVEDTLDVYARRFTVNDIGIVTINSPRARSAEEIASAWPSEGEIPRTFEEYTEALEWISANLKSNSRVVVTGSFAFVRDIRGILADE